MQRVVLMVWDEKMTRSRINQHPFAAEATVRCGGHNDRRIMTCPATSHRKPIFSVAVLKVRDRVGPPASFLCVLYTVLCPLPNAFRFPTVSQPATLRNFLFTYVGFRFCAHIYISLCYWFALPVIVRLGGDPTGRELDTCVQLPALVPYTAVREGCL
jgi:hypothetical protein